MEEITEILKIFKNIQSKREKGMFVEPDGTEPHDITEGDYTGLLKYAELAVKHLDSFISYKYIPYEELEKSIKDMIRKV